MEHELFAMVRQQLRKLGQRRRSRKYTYTDACIVAVYAWAAINDRPTLWACQPRNWPRGLRRGRLPSQSIVSRRLRSPSVVRLLDLLEQRVFIRRRQPTLVLIADGKPLPIAAHSADRQSGYGRAAGGYAKGYKLHALVDLSGMLRCWCIAPMNIDERVIAGRMLRRIEHAGYVLADTNYDSNKLFSLASDRGCQLVTPRRGGSGRGLGHRPQSKGRLHSMTMLEGPNPEFGQDLFSLRRGIERYFGRLSSGAGGLSCLPSWVRGYHRVHGWVQLKIILDQLRAERRSAAA